MLTVEALKNFGADTEKGIALCVGKEDFYLKMVRAAAGEPTFEKLEKAFAEENADDAFECAHALKGVFGNLALTPLSRPLGELTEKLRGRSMSGCDDLMKEIAQKHSELQSLL